MFNRLVFFVLVVASLLVGVVRAAFPPCAEACIGLADPGSCSLTDNAHDDWLAGYNYAVYLCNQAGITSTIVVNPPTKRTLTARQPERTFVPVYVRNKQPENIAAA
ncbi:hypothetical protein CTheo_6123 [Ceratobasidium theobromae]|uniref:Effector protein n=1 Tax=Ceratobasidium theobromae TaxID=1582974 RepID=A0A5N5QG40_9AGAM|nr:hypothetical protein CTheo_6123 [Ceratobasidium theobromae]